MNPENQRPNPVEDYIKKIVNENNSSENTVNKIPNKTPIESPVAQKAFEQRKRTFDPTGRIEDIESDEVKVADVRRHPFGLFIIYLQCILGIGLSVGLIAFLLPGVLGPGDSDGSDAIIGILVLFMTVLGAIFLILATRIYKANQLIITDRHVTQVQQVGLFSRKVSELTMANVEDVTANTDGIFPTLFNFGTIVVETAGEQNNFIFKYCPNPNAYAKALQEARSQYLRQSGHADD